MAFAIMGCGGKKWLMELAEVSLLTNDPNNRIGFRYDPPCKDCPERRMRCHSECIRFLDWQKERSALLHKVNAQRRAYSDAFAYTVNQKRKTLKKIGKK